MTGNLILSITSILLAIFLLIFSLQLPPSSSEITFGPGEWPNLILSLMILMGVSLLIKTIRQKGKASINEKENVFESKDEEDVEFGEEVYKTRYLWVLGVMFLYILALSFVGFVLSTPFLLAAVTIIMGMRKKVPILLISTIGSACLIYIFPILLNITLPRGIGVFRNISLLFY